MVAGHITKSELALIYMLRNDIITSDGLNSMWGRSCGADTLRDIEKRGWATEIKIEHKSGAKAQKYRHTCFAITQKGIEHLRKRGYNMNILAEEYNPIKEYTPRKRANPAKAAARFLKETIANIFFTQYGAITLPIVAANRRRTQSTPTGTGEGVDIEYTQPGDEYIYDDDAFFSIDDYEDMDIAPAKVEAETSMQAQASSDSSGELQDPFIPNLILMQQKKENAVWEDAIIPAETLFFCARSAMRKSELYTHEYREVSMSECAGILATSKKTMLVYTATVDGMPWSTFSAANDTSIVKAFNFNHRAINSFSNKASGILLTTAPHVLASVFFNRGKRKMRARFGTGLSSLYVVPATNEGIAFITHIMKDDLVTYARRACEELCKTGAYIENPDVQSKSEYPLIETTSGIQCAYGIDMNFNQVAKWYDALKSESEMGEPLSIKIICLDFQVPLYNAIFKGTGVEYITKTL